VSKRQASIAATLAALIVTGLLLGACSAKVVRGSRTYVTEAREVRGFDRVTLTGSGDVTLIQGERESLTVETDDNVMPYITTRVSGGTLTLGTKSGVSVSPTRLRFTLTVVDLEGITIAGSGNVTMERLDADRIEVKITGSGNVRIDGLEADRANVEVTGSGNVELAGTVNELEITVSGSGNYIGEDLRSETASIKVTGSGNATVWATESLDVKMTGSGSARYYGTPQVSLTGSGSGNVKSLGEK
jgi:hypothetical protein